MKIEFLNDDLTEARVTRGFWRWKEQALVRRLATGWYFTVNDEVFEAFPKKSSEYGSWCPIETERILVQRHRERARMDSAWTPVQPSKLPEARAAYPERGIDPMTVIDLAARTGKTVMVTQRADGTEDVRVLEDEA